VSLVLGVSKVGANRRAGLKILLLGAVMPLRDRLGWPVERSSHLKISVGGRQLDWWVGPKTDLRVLNEVLILGIYDDLPTEPKVILDLGSHIGFSILAFRVAYPEARIVGLEPDPATFARLRRNTAQLDNVEVRQLAVAPKEGNLTFSLSRQPWTSGNDASRGTAMVKATTLDRLITELKPNLLKLDIEGAEIPVLESADLGPVAFIVGEIHNRDENARLTELLPGVQVFVDRSFRAGRLSGAVLRDP
jgi:FkbM family methyltransferase